MKGEKTQLLLRTYLDAIGITGYVLHTAEDAAGFLLVVEIPKENGDRVWILKGKDGRIPGAGATQFYRPSNLSLLKSMLNIVGRLEGITPCLIIKLRT